MWEAAWPLPVWGRLGPPAHRSCAGSRSLASPRESGYGAVLALSPLAGTGSPWMPPPVSLRAPGRAGAARPRPCRRPLSPAAGRCRGEGTGCQLCPKRLRNLRGLGSRSAGPCFKAKIGCQFSADVSDIISPAGVTAPPSALGEGGELGTLFPPCLRAPLRASCS